MIDSQTAVDAVIQAHVDAVLDRLRAHTDLTAVVFEGTVPMIDDKPLNRYVTVSADNGTGSGERLDQIPVQLTMTFTIHWVSVTPEMARELAQAGIGQLRNFRPSIPGRRCWKLQHSVSRRIIPDKTVVPWLWFGVDEFDLRSTAAN